MTTTEMDRLGPTYRTPRQAPAERDAQNHGVGTAAPSADPCSTVSTRPRTPRLSQKDRVLHVLEDRGDAGLTWLDFAAEPPDGGTPVAHLAGVVRQLRDDGHIIRTIPVRTATGTIYGRYVLADDDRDEREWSS